MDLGGIAGTKHLDCIDVYDVSLTHQLTHYWINSETNKSYQSEVYAYDACTNCSVVRGEDNIDIYYVNLDNQLVHIWIGIQTAWIPISQVIYDDVQMITPTAVKLRDDIDIYCVRNDGTVIHLWKNPSTNQKHLSQEIFKGETAPMALSAVRRFEGSLHLFFVSGEMIYHLSNGINSEWEGYSQNVIFNSHPVSSTQLVATQFQNDIQLFYTDQQGFICQLSAGEPTKLKFIPKGRIGQGLSLSSTGRLSAVQSLNHIDVFYFYENRAFHTSSARNNNFEWTLPQAIQIFQQNQSKLVAFRPSQKAINLYYVSNEQLKHFCIEENTQGDWQDQESSSSQSNKLADKPILKWQQIEHQCELFAQGYMGYAYDWNKGTDHYQQGLIVKKYKEIDSNTIIQEIKMLDLLSPIYPQLCKFQVTQNNQIVGFTMKKISRAKKIEQLYFNKKNIYANNPEARICVILELRKEVIKLQNIGYCHSDIHLDNFLVRQEDPLSPNCSINLVDFGNSLKFDGNSTTNSGLTGLEWAIPPQAWYEGDYNPKGVNAYQLGKVSLQILLKKKFEQTLNGQLQDTETQISNLLEEGYNESVQLYIRSLIQEDIEQRVAALYAHPDISYQTVKIPSRLPDHQPGMLTELVRKQCHSVQNFKKTFGREMHEIIPAIRQKNKYEWLLSNENYEGKYLLWGSCGGELKDNVFVALNLEAALACSQILSSSCKFNKVELSLMKLQITEKLGEYNEIEAYAALFECKVEGFDARIAVGASKSFGVSDGSWSMKVFGGGFKFRTKIGFQLFGSFFYIDLKRLLPEPLHNIICSCASPAIRFFTPPLTALLLSQKLSQNISRKAKSIEVSIMNMTKFTWKLDHLYMLEGRTQDRTFPKEEIKPGEFCTFKVCKKLCFQGIQGYVSYQIDVIGQHIIFLFSNLYGLTVQCKEDNKVACHLLSNSHWNEMQGHKRNQLIFREVWLHRCYSNRWNELSQQYTSKQVKPKKTLKKIFYTSGQSSSKSIFYVLNNYMNKQIEMDKLKKDA